MRNESRTSGSGRGGEKPVAETRHGAYRLLLQLIKQRVMASDLVTIGPRLIFQPELSEGRLAELPITWDTPYECWMLATAERWRSPVVKAAAEMAKAAASA